MYVVTSLCYIQILIFSFSPPQGRLPADHLWNRRRPSRWPLPLQIPSQAYSHHLPLQSNMGKPQPNLLKCPPPHRQLPLLLDRDERSRLPRSARYPVLCQTRFHCPPTRLCPQPHRCRPDTRSMETNCPNCPRPKALPLFRLCISRFCFRRPGPG